MAKQHSATVDRQHFEVTYDVPSALCESFERELGRGAMFIATLDSHEVGTKATVDVRLSFCDAMLELECEVVADVPADLARAGADPGVSLRIRESATELRQRIESITGLSLPEIDPVPPDSQRRSPRFPAQATVTIEAEGRQFSAETVDISYNGALVLLPGVDIGEDSVVLVHIQHPISEAELEIQGRVANQTRCDAGVMAVGVQFEYAFDRVDEVTNFLDELRGLHHARRLATVTGSLSDTPLESVLETFSSVSNEGTLVLTSGEDRGKVVYREAHILSATTGLVSGSKALGRMFSWTKASFEFRGEIEGIEDDSAPIPLQSALLSGAVERDEISRLPLFEMGPDETFTLDEGKLNAVASELNDAMVELAENAGMGFPLGALLDILTSGDAMIYKALSDLIDAGVLRVAEPD